MFSNSLPFFVCFNSAPWAVIGTSAPEGYYSPFVAKYLDYIDWIRTSLLLPSKVLLSML